MLAIEDNTSRAWAREMRGTASIAIAVTPAAASLSTSAGLRAGCARLTRIAPGRSCAISSSEGALIFVTMSAPQTVAGWATVAPAAANAASSKLARAPAPASTAT